MTIRVIKQLYEITSALLDIRKAAREAIKNL